jgi:hypothetical protein
MDFAMVCSKLSFWYYLQESKNGHQKSSKPAGTEVGTSQMQVRHLGDEHYGCVFVLEFYP